MLNSPIRLSLVYEPELFDSTAAEQMVSRNFILYSLLVLTKAKFGGKGGRLGNVSLLKLSAN
jgi:hypothetical protein